MSKIYVLVPFKGYKNLSWNYSVLSTTFKLTYPFQLLTMLTRSTLSPQTSHLKIHLLQVIKSTRIHAGYLQEILVSWNAFRTLRVPVPKLPGPFNKFLRIVWYMVEVFLYTLCTGQNLWVFWILNIQIWIYELNMINSIHRPRELKLRLNFFLSYIFFTKT